MNRGYYGWLAGATLSTFGDATLFFALGWAAADLGPQVAGLVLTGYTLPRAVLLLAGGVLGDRWGPRRVLLTCDFLLAFLTLVLAGALHLVGTTAALLLLTAAAIGTVDAFVLPAAGAFPRLFADDKTLPKAMALRTSTQQVVTLAAGQLGGLLVAVAGLVGALVIDGLTFLVSFVILLVIKPPLATTQAPSGQSVVKEALDGIRLAWSEPVLRALLLTVGLTAAFVLPVTSLCVPLLARSNGWTASQAGLVVGATVVGSLLVTVAVARRGYLRAPWNSSGCGLPSGRRCNSRSRTVVERLLSAPLRVGARRRGRPVHVSPGSAVRRQYAAVPPQQAAVLAVAGSDPPVDRLHELAGRRGRSRPPVAVLACAGGTALAGVTLLTARSVRKANGGVS